MTTPSDRKLNPEIKELLIKSLQERFEGNMDRHPSDSWTTIEKKLKQAPEEQLWSLQYMEDTGGEPDVVDNFPGYSGTTFVDCTPESPQGRRSLCYDEQALKSRKQHKPKDSATHLAKTMGIKILTEEQYGRLQQTGSYDNKTSSWLDTPKEIRERGGAIFGDRRFGRVFTYHNGVESYYGVRGFRGALQL